MFLFFNTFLKHRFGPILVLTLLLVVISLVTRITLLIYSFNNIDFTVVNLLAIFLFGFFYDLINATYVAIPLVLYLWLMPQKWFVKPWSRFVLYGWFTLFTFLLLFNAASEILFWDEFNTRYNFIAVDYLVYTTEVLGNIWQSYPILKIVAGIMILTLVVVYGIRRWLKYSQQSTVAFKTRNIWALGLLVFPILFYFTVNAKMHRISKNAYVNELGGNGMYELFAAYINNELDYNQFYKTMDDIASLRQVRELLQTKESQYISNDISNLERKIIHTGEEKKLNVIMISVESLSAEFMEAFGNKNKITPFMDSLANHSLLFTNLYATGTRTVRGLEALSLCIPPTPRTINCKKTQQ